MSELNKVNILVVDDMPDKLLAMQAILEELGQNIVTVRSGREALRQMLDHDFAVILLDVNMPDMDGFETASLIRQRKRSEHTPIIFVTAFSDETHAWQGYSLGAVDYILAPVIPEVLRAKIGVFVDLYRKNQLIQQQAEERISLAQEQTARAVAETMMRRTAFLAEASSQLSRSLDLEATVGTFLRLAVHNLADVAGLVVCQDGKPHLQSDVCWSALDHPSGGSARIPLHRLPENLIAGIEQVAQSSEPLRVDNLRFGEHYFVTHSPEGNTVEVIPLVARGSTIAVFWHCRVSENQAAVDQSLVEALTVRAAIAIDNAQLHRKLKEGDRRKDEFLAMLGHELRNPLAAACNALDCLRHAGKDEQLADDAQEILGRQVQHMSRLVDDLLDVSRITQGKVDLRREVVDLSALVRRAVTITAATVAARLHQLSVSMPAGPMLLHADPTRIEQILANLISNAAKYTQPEGRINLKVERRDGKLVIQVIDNGIGISENLLPHVFELFTQGDQTLERAQGGLGIGLTLVHRLVELHGGTVSARSKGLNQGAEFTVELPEYTSPAEVETEVTPNGPLSPSRRILLVDDNEDLAFTMSVLLRRAGHEVQVACDGPSALECATCWQPEVMLIDIGLPGIDGYEVARRVREAPFWSDICLIAVTGYGQHEDRERSRLAGFDHHLVKPVAFDQLQQILAAHCPKTLPQTSHQ